MPNDVVPALTPERQFADLLATDASQPFVTYYDEATGERSELSAKSLANWVAKTHHLLVDELGLGVGDTALVALPAHWISVPILLGCLTAGLSLTSSGDADVAFVSPSTLDTAGSIPDVFVIAPDSAAVGFGDTAPEGAVDYVTAVRPQADAWTSVAMNASADDPAFDGLTRGDVVARAAELAAGTRLLSTKDWTSSADWISTVLAPIAARGSVVFVRNCRDEEVIERRMTQERATRRV